MVPAVEIAEVNALSSSVRLAGARALVPAEAEAAASRASACSSLYAAAIVGTELVETVPLMTAVQYASYAASPVASTAPTVL